MSKSHRKLSRCALFLALVALSFEWAAPQPVGAASRAPAYSRNGMVATSQVDATLAGVEMLAAGGNAIDAAVASAFAVGVTQPFSTGIGGGAFILIRLASGEVVAIDGRETAPGAADRDMYVRPGVAEDASAYGALAVGTPGMVAGLALALERHGTMTLAQVLAPAIRLARDGFAISPYHVEMMDWKRPRLEGRFPETLRIHYPADGVALEPGWRLVQTDLARTLEQIAERGPSAFYTGEIAEAIAARVQEGGGLITLEDLSTYTPRVREALRGSYRGYDIYSFPPPSSGGIALIEALNILEGIDLASYGAGSSASIHRIVEAMKFAFADRAAHLGDADFVEVPVARLTAKDYAAELRARINPPWWRRAPWHWGAGERALTLEGPGLPQDDSGTAHLSVTDAAGNAVAITGTINTLYGSGITVPGTGIVLNNEMDDFAKAPYEPNLYGLIDTLGRNAIAPYKRPLSSMTPTIVAKDGRTVFVTGSPGGPRIISTVLLTIVNAIDYGMDVQQAVSAPRVHHQWVPDKLRVEAAIPADVVDALRARGHDVDVSDWDWSVAEAIAIDAETGWHTGGSDPRSQGLALGP
ncbi:MAG: gamma-glutamyltransferase [Deltaproteobacteria bacterium]|jgi:gamma-glutamyltranspeptidase/glutathione hydrolase|nr:gamma-glutamyltransferase [Deltaproteobacteria bacterium]